LQMVNVTPTSAERVLLPGYVMINDDAVPGEKALLFSADGCKGKQMAGNILWQDQQALICNPACQAAYLGYSSVLIFAIKVGYPITVD